MLNLKETCEAGSEEARRVSEVQKQGDVRQCEAFLPSVLRPGGKEGWGWGELGRVVKSLSSHLLTSHSNE